MKRGEPMHIIDLEDNHYPAQITHTWDGDLNGNQSLSATIKPSKVNLKYLHGISEMWQIVDDDDTSYKIVYCKRKGEGNLLNVDIKSIPLFFDDFNNQRIYERHDRSFTANAYFSLVFEGSGYNFILNGTFESQQWEGLGEGATRLEMFKNGLNRYKAEFRIVGNTIYLENQIGNDSQFRYEHRLNASNIVQEIDANEFYTYAKGYGDYGDGQGGEDWQNAKLIREYTSPLAQIPAIGIREAPPIKNGNITTTATMDSQLKILVDESLKISVSADIHDLRKQGYPIAQSQLGDRVFLIDRRIGFDEEIRVVAKSVTKNWKGEIIALNLTFGVLNITKRHQSSLSTAMKNITSLLEGKIKLPFSVLDNAVAEATKALQNAQTELTFSENGILAIDKNNPNNVVLFNSAGVGVSTDGGATFGQAMTANGFNADYMYTGTMLADRIAGGYLTSLNGISDFDLNNGKLHVRQGAITIERPDGALFVQNGIPTFELNVQASDPPYRNLVTNIGSGWLETKETTNQSVNYYSFKHVGRYLRVFVVAGLSRAGYGNGAVVVSGPGINEQIIVTDANDNFNTNGHTIMVDLGVPTYTIKNFYLSIRTGREDNPMRIRTLRVIQEG